MNILYSILILLSLLYVTLLIISIAMMICEAGSESSIEEVRKTLLSPIIIIMWSPIIIFDCLYMFFKWLLVGIWKYSPFSE